MNFRRLPFQFKSTDPAKRQAELEKRFGLNTTTAEKKMHLDLGNPNFMDMKREPSSASSSPRLQHRVPVFRENGQESSQSTTDSNPTNVDGGQKPRVRVVPIEVETGDSPSRRARNLSGDQGFGATGRRVKDPWFDVYEPRAKMEPSMFGPKVCNIPVKVEGSSQNGKPKSPATVKKIPVKKEQVVKNIPVQREEVPKPVQHNGCNVSKQREQAKKPVPPSPAEVTLQKIAVVLDKLKGYQVEVEKFSGTPKDKQYRYLDEMLTRLMLDLDNIETMGNDEVRLARKDAVKKVQHCVDLLETKVCDTAEVKPSQDPPQEMMVQSQETPAESTAEVEMAEADQEPESDKPEADQTMETEVQPGADVVSHSEEVCEQVEGLQDIEVTEVEAEGDAKVETEVEPVVDLNTSDELVNEVIVEEPKVKITELEDEASHTQVMDIDEEKVSEDVVVTKLEKDCDSVELNSENIPETKTDNELDSESVENQSDVNSSDATNISQS